jgi:hypothetical protein
MVSTPHDPTKDPAHHIQHVPITTISKLAPFSALIMSIIFVIYFLIKKYILELFLLRKIYGQTYTTLSESARRSFLNHHIAGATKIFILILAAYPFIDVAFGTATLPTTFVTGSTVTMGDILIVAAQMLMAMYVFELIYRDRVSPVSVVHHIGTIMVGQSAIAISLDLVHERDATIEFILCTVWGKLGAPPFFRLPPQLTHLDPHRCLRCFRGIPAPRRYGSLSGIS